MDARSSVEYILSTVTPDTKTELCDVMTSSGSDKGNGHHNYTVLYSHLFGPVRNRPIKLFEMGLGTNDITIPSNMGIHGVFGASVYGWEKYFTHPDTRIYGADIDDRIQITTDKITTYYCNQLDADSLRRLYTCDDLKNVLFDIIIDDGLHTFDACSSMLKNSFHKLAPGGIYIVEDVHEGDMFENLKHVTIDGVHYMKLIRVPGCKNILDNNLLVIQKSFNDLELSV